MDVQINDLQKIFGKTPINLNSRAISFVSKKTRNTLIVVGGLLLLGGTAFYFYKKGKKSSADELEITKMKLKEHTNNTTIKSESKSFVPEYKDIRKVETIAELNKDFINRKTKK